MQSRKGFTLLMFVIVIVPSLLRSIPNGQNYDPLKIYEEADNNNEIHLRSSSYWVISPIVIDETNPSSDWSETASGNDWCSGAGTYSDPYVIENLVIDGANSTSCIDIINSDVYFIIQNCTLYNSGLGSWINYQAGIRLNNTTNGFLISNNASNNGGYGIHLFDYSNNNTIEENTVHGNQKNGIELINSDYNTIVHNDVFNNLDGIEMRNSENNIVQNNYVYNNTIYGIQCIGYEGSSDHNLFEDNYVGNNTKYGFYISSFLGSADYNNYSGNVILGNGQYNAYDDGGFNNMWSVNDAGNFWGNYSGVDANGDGIGDTPYSYIYGGFYQDDFPIFEDPTYRGETIHIDGTGINSFNWSQTAKLKWSCSGLGTPSNPYLIQDLTINGQATSSCIFIENSNSIFTIKDNILTNSSVGQYYGGIELKNTSNGTIIRNNCSSNGVSGIILHNASFNNTISDNIVNKNLMGITLYDSSDNLISRNTINGTRNEGIYLEGGENNRILGNIASNSTTDDGICIVGSNGNLIFENTLFHNDHDGIYLQISNSNTISSNFVSENGYSGLGIIDSSDNTIYNNNFTTNYDNALDYSGSNFWDNGTIGNYFDDYTGVDANDDGIGDTSYTITGTSGSIDNYPIWRDNLFLIYIDDDNPKIDWLWAVTQSWCTGSGTEGDPYIIEDIIASSNALSNCITIQNSNKFFTIRNCTAYNAFGGQYYGGLKLENVSNGTITYCNFSSNGNSGIMVVDSSFNNIINGNTINNNLAGITFYNSNNNTILGNNFNNSRNEGIALFGSDNNVISTNIARYSSNGDGIYLFESDSNIISSNTLFHNDRDGIHLSSSSNNVVKGNIITQSGYIGLGCASGSNNNLFFNNSFTSNNEHAADYGVSNSWNSITLGNYWDNYTGLDIDDNGIGDTPFIFISGSSNAKDFFPIWEDDDDLIPVITINTPDYYNLFGTVAPNFNIRIIENGGIDSMWYTLNDGLSNTTFTSNGSLNQILWDEISSGEITVFFYCKDKAGHIGTAQVKIEKDIILPYITIHHPKMTEQFTQYSPIFNISIQEDNLDSKWYVIEGVDTTIFLTHLVGVIDTTIWNSLPNGPVIIRFYANDTIGNVGSGSVVVIKQYSSENNGGDEGGQETVNPDFIGEFFNSPTGILTTGIIFGVMGATIIYLFMRRNHAENKQPFKHKDKLKKSSLKRDKQRDQVSDNKS